MIVLDSILFKKWTQFQYLFSIFIFSWNQFKKS